MAAAAFALLLALQAEPAETRDYDRTVRSNARVADAMQGPLDGAWIVAGADGRRLYRLQIADPLNATHPPEGAWRDLAAGAGPQSAGLLSSVLREAASLTVSFDEADGQRVTLTLTPGPNRTWRGSLTRGGGSMVVTMTEQPDP